ncbi:MAG: DUF1858 domain-containing protein [Firmicutes bacterium]|nr:DUF1858 domain-containing protein [Bacillota bacterium]
MKIFEVLQKHSAAREVLAKYGMGCLGCMGATMESLESGAKMHGINLDALLADLNRLLEEKEA